MDPAFVEWFDHILAAWLHQFNPSHLTLDLIEDLNRVRDCILQGERQAAYNLIDLLKSGSVNRVDALENAEVHLWCARYLLGLGDVDRAFWYLETALQKYRPHGHYIGSVLWVLGCAYWSKRDYLEARSNWQGAIRAFDDLSCKYSSLEEGCQWYQEQLLEMRTLLRLATPGDPLPDRDAVLQAIH